MSCHTEGSVGTAGNEEQNPALYLLDLSLKQKRWGTVSDQKENAFCANQPVDLLFPEAAE